jgi:ribosomal protein L18
MRRSRQRRRRLRSRLLTRTSKPLLKIEISLDEILAQLDPGMGRPHGDAQ